MARQSQDGTRLRLRPCPTPYSTAAGSRSPWARCSAAARASTPWPGARRRWAAMRCPSSTVGSGFRHRQAAHCRWLDSAASDHRQHDGSLRDHRRESHQVHQERGGSRSVIAEEIIIGVEAFSGFRYGAAHRGVFLRTYVDPHLRRRGSLARPFVGSLPQQG